MKGPNGGYMKLFFVTKPMGTTVTFIHGLSYIFRCLYVVTFDCCYVQACHHLP